MRHTAEAEIFGMANDYGLMWMNQNHMMPEGGVLQGHSEIMSIDQNPQMDSNFFPMPMSQPFESVAQTPMELDGFLMMDDFDGDNDCCGDTPRYITAATQTIPHLRTKKIRPVAHPGLKLQTPIAFKSDSDPNAIPIVKDGMAICLKCGAMGVRHAFYTRHRNYCSLACARNENKDEGDTSADDSQSSDFKYLNSFDIKEEPIDGSPCSTMENSSMPLANFCQKPGAFPFTLEVPEERAPEPLAKKDPPCAIWMPYFKDPSFVASPVNCFKHAPMADCWQNITEGMKVEVESYDAGDDKTKALYDSFWVATVLKIAGYHALLRYEGYDAGKDFWVNLCCSNVHPVGWCATRGKPLIPPKLIAETCKDWKEFLVGRLTGACTLPFNFHVRVGENLKSRFRVGMLLEVLDKDNISRMSLATIRQIVGKRMHVTYYNAAPECGGFWFHEDSPLIHPVGWSVRVGLDISAPDSYLERCENGIMDKDDASEELFTAPYQSVTDWNESSVFEKGMKLEASDPLNPISISAATVAKILADGYLMIRIDSSKQPVTYFCYHSHSPLIFPAGFCGDNGIPLAPPDGYAPDKFSWDDYVRETGCVLAPISNFNTEVPDHGFVPGMHLEAADIMMPQDLNVATVSMTVGRLLKIHFDGWTDDYDQWMDCASADIYPVGWCGLNSYNLNCPPKAVKGTEKKKPGRRCKKVKGKVKTPPKKQSLDIKLEDMQGSSSNTTLSPGENDAESLGCFSETTHSPEETSDVPLATNPTNAFIPRLGDSSSNEGDLDPSSWNCHDVVTFLRLNDCGDYADNFLAQKKTGSDLLNLTEETLMDLTGKTGPTVKIFDLIKQLKQLLRVRAAKASRRIKL